ncbi:plasmid mobilization protein [Microbacterium sp. M]|uniref:plasmid mobilization protein n=1 Tax=Microbacterium sp. M TaxID=3377125 RepID=UPI003869EB7D
MTREYGRGRTRRLSLALAPDEAARIGKWAEAHGMTTAEYVRMRALEDPIERVAA